MYIVVIDDSREDLEVIRAALKKNFPQYEVQCFSSGAGFYDGAVKMRKFIVSVC